MFPGVETGMQSVATVDASARRTRGDVPQPHRHYGSKVRSRLGTDIACVCVWLLEAHHEPEPRHKSCGTAMATELT